MVHSAGSKSDGRGGGGGRSLAGIEGMFDDVRIGKNNTLQCYKC